MKYAASPILVLALGIFPALAQTSDTTAPLLTSFFFSPTSVDVSSAPQTVIVTAVFTDDLSGFAGASVAFTSPNGQTVGGMFTRTAGTALAGSYQATVTVRQFLEPGVWTAEVLFLRDLAGNSRNVTTSDLQSHSFPANLTVIDSAPDTTPPTMTAASFSPASIDVSANDVSVTVSFQVTDNLSGACFGSCFIGFGVALGPPVGSPSSAQKLIAESELQLVSGTALNGTWQAVVKMPRFSPAGNWQIATIRLRDDASNQVILQTPQLQAAGINPVLSVSSSPSDTTPPALTGLNFSPPLFNTSAGPQTMTITMSASDNLSGVDFSPTTTSVTERLIEFVSPSGGQTVFVNAFISPINNVGGTPLSGTWQLLATWPQFSEEGTWNISFLDVKDAAANEIDYTPAMLEAMGLPDTIVVTKPSLNVDGTVGTTGGSVTDDSFGSRASVTFPSGIAPDHTSVSIDVFPNPLPVPTPSGFTVPGTYFVNVAFSPALTSPLPSPGITVVLPLLTPMTPGAHLKLYHIDPVTGTLQPTTDAFRNTPVDGIVNSGGVSVTFHNVVTLSTVVAFLPNGSVLGDVNNDGLVDCTDVSLLKASFGKRTGQAGFNSNADLNNDGVVDIRDLMVVTRQLSAGTTCP